MTNTYKPGIYFNMPDAEYFAIEAMSASGVKDMLISPLNYQCKAMNGAHNDDTDAKIRGKAYHCFILEGVEAYEKRFAFKPEGMSFATKDGKAWRAEQQEAGKMIVKQEVDDEIRATAKIIDAAGLTKGFEGGHSEVVILWHHPDTDVLCKAKIDYLKPSWIVDLKTFSNTQQREIKSAVNMAMAYNKMYIQPVHYLRGLKEVKKLLKSGEGSVFKCTGSAHHLNVNRGIEEFCNAMADFDDHRFLFIFKEAGNVPHVIPREFSRLADNLAVNEYWKLGEALIDMAVFEYRRYMANYGKDKPWVDEAPIIKFDDADFPLWMFENK